VGIGAAASECIPFASGEPDSVETPGAPLGPDFGSCNAGSLLAPGWGLVIPELIAEPLALLPLDAVEPGAAPFEFSPTAVPVPAEPEEIEPCAIAVVAKAPIDIAKEPARISGRILVLFSMLHLLAEYLVIEHELCQAKYILYSIERLELSDYWREL